MTAERCGVEKDDGERCAVTFGLCECHGQCFSHAPCRTEERQDARERGGRAAALKARGSGVLMDELPPLETHEAAEAWCDTIGRAGAAELISSAAANAGIRAVKEWRECRGSGQVSDRLKRLMDALSEWRKTGDPEPVLELVDGSS